MDLLLSVACGQLLLFYSTQQHTAASALKAALCAYCSEGQKCELRRKLCDGKVCRDIVACVPNLPPSQRPPSCQNVACSSVANVSEVCVLHEVNCFRAPCYPITACIPNMCTLALCSESGTVCVTVRQTVPQLPVPQLTCSSFPACLFTTACVPRAKPKPGFCPPQEQVSSANVSPCEYDNDCPSDLLCCPGVSEGGRNCTAPAFPDPCESFQCPPAPDIIGGTCVVRGGNPSCADRVCQPGSFFCRDGKQFYCSDGGEVIPTGLLAPNNCQS